MNARGNLSIGGDLRVGGSLRFGDDASVASVRLDLDNAGVIIVDGAPEAGVPPGGEVSLGKIVRDHLRVRHAIEGEIAGLKRELAELRAAAKMLREQIETVWYAPGMPGFAEASEHWSACAARRHQRKPRKPRRRKIRSRARSEDT